MKIGIMTFYYQSINYGGNLQAYALGKFLDSLGYDAELICYKMENWRTINAPDTFLKKISYLTVRRIIKALELRVLQVFWKCTGKENKYRTSLRMRESAFHSFNYNRIRHSKKVYDDADIESSGSLYDVFIAGSDQIWNPDCYLQPFYLEFVPLGKRKIAYAASLAKTKLTERELAVFRTSLKSFDAISVREKTSINLLSSVSPVNVSYVLDPTLLLDVSEWKVLCEDGCIERNYIFCYFLGTNTGIYGAIKKFARNHGLKIVNIPFMAERYLWKNDYLGDISMTDAGPERFLTLIRDASYVFTDSFHAVIFSYLFQKQFFVFNRDVKQDISERLYDLLELLNLKERFCNTAEKEKYNYISNLEDVNYCEQSKELKELKQISVEFLKKNISGEVCCE